MGWLWTSSPSSKTSSSDKEPSNPSPTTSSNPRETSPPSDTTPPPKPLTRDEQAEAELQSFLRELSSDPSSSSSSTSTSSTSSLSTTRSSLPPNPFFSTPQTSLPTSTSTTSSSPSSSTTSDPHSPFGTSIYPSSMSCRSYFDAAYHCQLPGGQFLNVYRHGSLRDCTDLWSSFWFCMRTNRGFMSEEEREERVRGFYKKREEKLKQGSSSEDVWRARGEGEGIRDEDCWGGRIFGGDLDKYLRGEDG